MVLDGRNVLRKLQNRNSLHCKQVDKVQLCPSLFEPLSISGSFWHLQSISMKLIGSMPSSIIYFCLISVKMTEKLRLFDAIIFVFLSIAVNRTEHYNVHLLAWLAFNHGQLNAIPLNINTSLLLWIGVPHSHTHALMEQKPSFCDFNWYKSETND